MKALSLLAGVAGIALTASTASAQSSTADQAGSETQTMASDPSSQDPANDIVVTGSARAQRRFDVSYAVNTLGQDEIKRLAPNNFIDLLGLVPGIQPEATAGEVHNLLHIRGIPTDEGLSITQQDGLVLFHDSNGYFNRGDSINRYDLMTERVEIVRGGPSSIYGSQAAAIVNNITMTGTPETRGKAQVQLGTTGLARFDAFQAGPLSENTFYAIGGFIRRDEGQRKNGFPADRGGQIRANIKHDLSNGWLKLSANYLNDHNVFYLPIPIADPRDPNISLNPYLDYFKGTLNSPAFRNVNVKFRDGNNTLRSYDRDLADGRHMRLGNIGLQYNGEFDGYIVNLKAGYTRGNLSFDALYSITNPADGGAYANSFLTAANAAFGGTARGPVTRMGYAIAGTNGATTYDPASASGLVIAGQYRFITSKFYSDQGDLSLTKEFQTGLGTHDVRVGAYGSSYGERNFQVFQDHLMEIRNEARTLDLYAYNASGQTLGGVTDRGVLRYATTLNQGTNDATVLAVYANDTWKITENLTLDGGVRHERYDISGFGLNTTQVDLGDSTTLADNTTRAFTGTSTALKISPNITNWTAGINYDVSRDFGAYARVSHLEVPPYAFATSNPNSIVVTTKANQYEVGLKATMGRSYLYVTGFYTKFNPFNASFAAFNPTTGRNDVPVPFIGQVVIKGLEADGALRLGKIFTLNGSLTIQDPEYRNFTNTSGADPTAVNGSQVIREAKVFGNIRPTLSFDLGEKNLEVYGRYSYIGRRYVDLFNLTSLPAFGTFNAGITFTTGTWQFQAVGDNITNAHGLTEGNGRVDALAGQGSKNAIYGRPIFGRSVRFVVSKSW